MSYSEQTPYLGLPIRSASDTFNTMDNNDAFRTTDTKVKQAVDDSAQAKEDATEAKSNASEAINAVGELEGIVEAQGGALDEHAERLVILSNRVTAQAGQIALKANASSIAPLYDDEAGTYEVDAVVMHNGQLYKCNTQITTPETFDVNKWDVIDVESLIGGGSTPTTGDTRYNTITGTLQYYDGTNWVDVSIGGGGMLLDASNAISLIGVASYTTSKDGELKVSVTNGSSGDVQIDGNSVFTTSTPDSSSVGILNLSFAIPAGTVITNNIDTSTSKARIVKFYPYL